MLLKRYSEYNEVEVEISPTIGGQIEGGEGASG